MSVSKTYLLAPNFTLHPDGPLRLGSIIADPFRPTKSLFIPKALPETITHSEFERTISHGDNSSLRGSVWAQFLQTANANIGGGVSRDITTEYTMDSLETIYFKSDPTDKQAAEYAKIENVQSAMRGPKYSKRVFMITGLKIAKGFRLSSETGRTKEGNVGAGLPVVDQVSLGADFSRSKGKSMQESYRAGSDIIFAYQLHVIAEKGWRHKRVTIDIHADDKGHFMDRQGRVVGAISLEASSATPAELLGVAEELKHKSVNSGKAKDGRGSCVVIGYRER